MGGDRRVVGSAVLLGVVMGWLLINAYGAWVGVPVGATIWVMGVWAGREMFKADPYALEIWLRHMKYRKFYRGRAHHASEVPVVRDFIS